MADFLTEALKWGYSKKDIADYLAQESGEQDFVTKARGYGYKDDQIIAELMGSGAGKAFTSQFEQGFKSSLQGIGQMLGMADTEDIKAQREAADILSSNNPYVGFAGSLVGNILDPVALPAAAVAPLRGATLARTLAKKGAAQGAFSGFVEPVTKEDASTGPVSLDRVLNTIIGAPLGAAIGGGAGAIIQRFSKKADVPEVDVGKTQEETTTAARKAIDDLTQTEQGLTKVNEEQQLAIDRINKLKEERTLLEEQLAAGEPRPVAGELTPMQRMFAEGPTPARPVTGELTPTQRMFAEGPSTPRPVTGELTPLQRMFAQGPTAPRPITGGAQALTPMQRMALEGPQVEGMSAARMAAINGPTVEARPITGGPAALTDTQRMFLRGPEPQTEVIKGRIAKIDEEISSLTPVLTKRTATPAATSNATPTQKLPAEPEAPKASETDYAEGRSALNLGFGKGSIGSAETPKELVYAGDVPFNTKAEKVFSDYKPKKVTVANIRNDAEDTELVNKIVMATGSTGRGLRGQRLGPASYDNMGRRAEAAEARMTKEASDLIDWAFQFKNNEWTADEIAAIAPQFYKSVDFLRNTMREYNALRAAGKMTDDLETEIMLKSQMHLGIVTIFQGQRSRASAKMNALKFAKDRVLNGERVNGYATPGAGCV